MSHCCATDLPAASPAERTESRPGSTRLALAAFLAGNSVLAALVVNLSDMPAATRSVFYAALAGATAAVALLVGAPLARRLWQGLGRRNIALELLFVLGCAGALGVSAMAVVRGQGAVYFEVVAVLLVIYAAGDRLKSRAQSDARRLLRRWDPSAQQCERRKPCGALARVYVADVRAGDEVRVAAGRDDIVPVDGVVVDGAGFVRTTPLTGDIHAQALKSGDAVAAGSAMLDGTFVVRASAAGTERRIDAIRLDIDRAHASRTAPQRLAERLAGVFAAVVAVVAVATTAAWWFAGYEDRSWLVGLSVLLVACPCGFGFATPTAVWVGLQSLVERGLRVRSGDALEALATVDVVAFDKTGTLTAVEPRIASVSCPPGATAADRREVLRLAASLQRASGHPVAAAFRGLPADFPVEHLEALPGVGVRGVVGTAGGGSARVEVGRLEGLVEGPTPSWAVDANSTDALYRVAIRVNDNLAAVVDAREHPVASLAEGLRELRRLGVEPWLVTGDGGPRARATGILNIVERAGPEAKARWVADQARAGRRVLFVGDGENDAAAMGVAHVAVATATAAPLASACADATWLSSDPRQLASAIELARRTRRRLVTTLWFAAAYNAIGIAAAAAGLLHPVLAAVLMMGSSLFVNLRAGMSEEREAPGRTADKESSIPGYCAAARVGG